MLKPEELVARKARYEELYTKPEAELSEAEAEELLSIANTLEEVEKKEEEEVVEKKKFAGIYETEEALLEGIANSETERKRIAAEAKKDPALAGILEGAYKDSQREVTKLVRDAKGKGIKPIHERRLHEVSQDEYKAWSEKSPMDAQAWLTSATALNEKQKESGLKVFAKHPEFHAMLYGAAPKSKEFETFDRLCVEHPEWERLPNGSEMALEAMEKELGSKELPKGEDKPKPVKKEEKPSGLEAGKAKAAAGKGSARLTTAQFEALSPEEQREYLEGQAPEN